MCGRFLLDADVEELLDRYRRKKALYEAAASAEVFPTNKVPVITSSADIIAMKWGFPNPYSKSPVINARGETVHIKPMFKDALLLRRCIIPANAFFEWKKDGKNKIKYKIFLEDENIFSMAGLYGDFTNDQGERLQAFTIITTSPNSFMSQIHDRMPVILPRDREEAWLDPDVSDINAIRRMLIPPEELDYGMKAVAV